MDLGKWSEAEIDDRKALAILEKLATDFPDVPEHRDSLALSYHHLGIRVARLGRPLEAEAAYRKSLAIEAKLVGDFPTVAMYRHWVALYRDNLGDFLKGMGRQSEAEEEYRKALVIYEKLANDFPTVPIHRYKLAASHNNLGFLLHEQGKRLEEEEEYCKALAIQEKLAADYPEVALYRYPVPNSRSLRAISRVNAGQIADGIAEIAKLTNSPNWDWENWYSFACVYASASAKSTEKKKEYGDRAMELLNKAVQAGFKDSAHMKEDGWLISLWEREDFKKLVAKLATGNEAAKKQ
jgi:tetratricopeptide (TPR) repeat protein